jgi:hypothetical protein
MDRTGCSVSVGAGAAMRGSDRVSAVMAGMSELTGPQSD